jgi:Na+/proline symporter
MMRVTDALWKVRLARAGVLLLGLVAYGLALNAEGVFALVEQASAFGSAGILVTVLFALFTTWGGAATAMATLVAGVLSYSLGVLVSLPTPFLLSLIVAIVVYLVGSLVEVRRSRVSTAAA